MDRYLLDGSGQCTSCENSCVTSDCVTCDSCKKAFHAICPSAPTKEDYACSTSFLRLWHLSSTKDNFKWYCDKCLTNMETISNASLEAQFHSLVEKVTELTSEVRQLKKQSANHTPVSDQSPELPAVTYGGSWADPKSVQNLRSSLLIKPVSTENGAKNTPVSLESIRKIVVENNIPVSKVGVSANGETFVHCPSTAARDKLQPLLETDLPSQTVVSLKEKLPSISIVGITGEISKETLINDICNQNSYVNDLVKEGHTFKILFIKPPSDGYSNYQVVARLSPSIRDAISAHHNRLYIGLESCRVYDRFYVKRCNKCNCFGHYKAHCSNKVTCGYCTSESHESEQCPLKNSKDCTLFSCINCKRNGLPHEGHSAFWYNCPSYIVAQKKMQSTIPYYDSIKNKT